MKRLKTNWPLTQLSDGSLHVGRVWSLPHVSTLVSGAPYLSFSGPLP